MTDFYLAAIACGCLLMPLAFWLVTRGDYRDQKLGAELREACGGRDEAVKELTEIRIRNAQLDSLMRAGMRGLTTRDIDELLGKREPIRPTDFRVNERGRPLNFEDGAA